MNIEIVTPAPRGSRTGNRVTARRWARILRQLGHRVSVTTEYHRRLCDALVALHARKSFPSIEQFRRHRPEKPLIVALTGTDVYGDIHSDPSARRSLKLATRLIVLQPLALEQLPHSARSKARVIHQSASPPAGTHSPKRNVFEICVLGHLRPVKDPFRTARAARLLPASSTVRVVQIGAALTSEMNAEARAEVAANPRYQWLGERTHWQALRVLARSRLLVVSSTSEGGANVVSEALAAGVPIIASAIPGSIGILGRDYPGYYPVEDTEALAALLERAERDQAFYQRLRSKCQELAALVEPSRERERWHALLRELTSGAEGLSA